MRLVAAVVVGTLLVGAGAFVASVPGRVAAQQAQDRPAGPIVGESTDFKEKSRVNGNAAYFNLGARTMAVTIVIESGTDQASLFAKDPQGRATLLSQVRAGTMDRQRTVTADVAPNGSLWVKSDGGTAHWQVLGAAPAQ
jgi:hypothetical protein